MFSCQCNDCTKFNGFKCSHVAIFLCQENRKKFSRFWEVQTSNVITSALTKACLGSLESSVLPFQRARLLNYRSSIERANAFMWRIIGFINAVALKEIAEILILFCIVDNVHSLDASWRWFPRYISPRLSRSLLALVDWSLLTFKFIDCVFLFSWFYIVTLVLIFNVIFVDVFQAF